MLPEVFTDGHGGIRGTGYALNFGHPGAKTIIGGLFIVPVAVALTLVLLRFFG